MLAFTILIYFILIKGEGVVPQPLSSVKHFCYGLTPLNLMTSYVYDVNVSF